MPYKSGKLKDELTTAEIRKLVRAHNAVIKKNLIIKIPAGSTRDKIIKIINDKGFDIRHAQKRIEPLDNVSAYDYISLDMVEKILKKPEKTELQKQKTAEAKQAREQKKKKEEREIRKKAVQEEKARAKPKAKPKTKTATIETQTEKPKPKKEPKKQPLAIADKPKGKGGRPKGAKTILNFSKLKAKDIDALFKQLGLGRGTMKDARADLKGLINSKESDFQNLKKEYIFGDKETGKDLENHDEIKTAYEKLPGIVKKSQYTFVFSKRIKGGRTHIGYELRENRKSRQEMLDILNKFKPEDVPEKTFKIEAFERRQRLNKLSEEIGRPVNPFKVLGIKASEETPELVKKRCRELRLKEHPDKGGDPEKFDLIQNACRILLETQTLKKKK
jgi:uncharacterized protein YeeX (DUF496 family)